MRDAWEWLMLGAVTVDAIGVRFLRRQPVTDRLAKTTRFGFLADLFS